MRGLLSYLRGHTGVLIAAAVLSLSATGRVLARPPLVPGVIDAISAAQPVGVLVTAPVLVLDEPTSQLDAANEAALRQVVFTAAADRPLIVGAHRLSTVIDADQILILEEGRVTGAHHELINSNARYRELVNR